ncbi:phage tail protein [Proteus myxofaciens]|uniref:Phage tail fiber protein n=1 Tax=Proteus myxofaciens ATCC 19692 TaxID=1354337 RepID=A0A198GSC6_9GAMM|nr:phage tail protein [Proteus myxofaciens]OAT39136.1 phage tail fiber protein [Proteus myxofaciens ATCC 19692]
MSAKFFALLTVIGANKLAKATALGTTLKITHMAVGDGGGTLPTPDTQQTKLVGEKRRAGLNTLFVDPKNDSQIIAEQVIPENEGGYWIREIGLFDDEGSLIAVGNCPETYKPQLQEGSGRTQTIRMILTISHTESVELKVDPSVILATRDFVNDAIESASKEILKEVKETYATKEEVKKKFNIDNVVHEKGASKEKVISQFGTTELFQPKGDYALVGSSYTKKESDGRYQAKGNYQPAGNYANKGDSYIKTESDGRYQAKGNYAPAGNYALVGDSYTKIESDGRYQAKGSSVPNTRKVNGKALSDDINITSQDIFGDQAIYINANQNLDNYKTPGVYCQSFNANTSIALNYPEASAGTLLIVKNAGITQLYYVYDSSRIYSRAQYSNGGWSPWAREYNTQNKPSASDVGAYSKGESNAIFARNDNVWSTTSSDARYQPKGNYGAKSTANKSSSGWWKCGDTGMIIQWGNTGNISRDGNKVITFPLAFPTICVSVTSVAARRNGDQFNNGISVESLTKTTCNFVHQSYDNSYHWMAIGY